MPTIITPDPCQDSSYFDCNKIIEWGTCIPNPRICYKSCNCDLKMCVDKLDECKEMAENTEGCQTEQMQKDCYKSCFPEICSNTFFTTTTTASTTTTTTTTTENTPPPCADRFTHCNLFLWKCQSDWAKMACKKSCNHCDLCTDNYLVCADYAKEGICQDGFDDEPDYMIKNCRKSCGFCH